MMFGHPPSISISLSKPYSMCSSKAVILCWLCSGIAGLLSSCSNAPQEVITPPLIHLPAGEIALRPAGKTLYEGRQISPPVSVEQVNGLTIMQRQVSQAEYMACVQAEACQALDNINPQNSSTELPVTGINWHDAQAYAAWLSQQTGQQWRLPTYAEWAYAAGELFRPEALMIENDDPAQQWLAAYEEQIRRDQQQEDTRVRAFGDYGRNRAGLLDMTGSTWEWTSDCYTLRIMDNNNTEQPVSINTHCGVRVAAGRHTAYITDFIRDPKNGACSVGTPPAHLGVRLVLQPNTN